MRLVLLKATRRISNEMDLDLRVWTSSLKNSLGGGFNHHFPGNGEKKT